MANRKFRTKLVLNFRLPHLTQLEQVVDMKVMARACQIGDGLHNHQDQHAFRFLKHLGDQLPVCYYKS